MPLSWEPIYVLGTLAAGLLGLLAALVAVFSGLIAAARAPSGARWPAARTALRRPAQGLVLALVVALALDRLDWMRLVWRLTGQIVPFEHEIASYESETHFNGDGYSIYRYALPARVCRGVAADPNALDGLPQIEARPNKTRQRWRATPLDEAGWATLGGMWAEDLSNDSEALPDLMARLEAALHSPGNRGAWGARIYAHEGGSYVSNLEI